MLFLQGTPDAPADIGIMIATMAVLGERTTLVEIEDGDHSFHVRARSGRTDAHALTEMLDPVAAWIEVHAKRGRQMCTSTPSARASRRSES
jgi:uncharacterized protein